MVALMSQFKKNLESLPGIDGIERLELVEGNKPEPVAVIENKPGKSGSVAVYNFLKSEYDQLNYESAKIGLELFAEHVISAAENPGAHPNIDFLFDVIENDRILTINIIKG